jgi:hypothetical protein
MSKTMCATPIWLGGACSNEVFLLNHLAIVPNGVVEHLHCKLGNNLKCVQVNNLKCEHVGAMVGESEKSVQNILIRRGQHN